MLMGHLGTRVSALLDGQLPPDEAERAWAHVHACHLCRDLVEREGWVKTRLSGLGGCDATASDSLKGSLMGRIVNDGAAASPHGWATWPAPPGDVLLAMSHQHRPRRAVGIAAIGGGAVGAAMMGVLALGAAPADAPTIDRRVPATSITQPGPPQVPAPARRSTGR
jgi:anti-sigma factor RsiW